MMIPVPAPKPISLKTLSYMDDPAFLQLFSRIDADYLYWDKAKYLKPKDIDESEFWTAIRFMRRGNRLDIGNQTFHYKINTPMQNLLHEFDVNFRGDLPILATAPGKQRQSYLLSSMMEESIASSQMEGASTTRVVAKDMLRRKVKPRDRSQQMIFNNYKTIRFLSDHKDEPLSLDLMLDIHNLITEKTLDKPLFEGRFRDSDDVLVLDDITSEVAHVPPAHDQICTFLDSLCDFVNDDAVFIHPIVKAIILHFMISYLHPFVDGNGRTARSLFYWFMLKKGYGMAEYLSISRIIYRSKAQYERAFLYVENDANDLGYFINYNLIVLSKAFSELKSYLERKASEQDELFDFRSDSGLNERQKQMIRMALEKPSTIFLCRELENQLNICAKTIRSDLCGLVDLGLFEVVALNQRLRGYRSVPGFEEKLASLKR